MGAFRKSDMSEHLFYYTLLCCWSYGILDMENNWSLEDCELTNIDVFSCPTLVKGVDHYLLHLLTTQEPYACQ